MKKVLFILFALISITTHAQVANGTETKQNAFRSLSPQTATTVNYLTTMGTDGTMGRVTPVNVTIPTVPLNYSVLTPTLGAHLQGIDNRFGTLVATTAGNTTRVWFTGDATTIGAGTFYLTNATNKGTVANVSQSVINDDDQKKYFTQDLIGNAFATTTIFPPGVYAGNLSGSTTPNSARQKFTVELYRCDTNGNPIASGVAGAPVGDLGVTVIIILDSGELTLADGSVTNVSVSANLATSLTINVGERIRYHVSAAKIGTAASNITESVWYGSSFNSYLDVPTPITSSGVSNLSTVTGATVTTALDNLKASIPVVYSTVVYVNSTDPNSATIFDDVNPPVTNDNALKANVNNLYVASDNTGWVYNSTSLTYVTKPATVPQSNFYLSGSTIDAGSDKVSYIERPGTIGAGSIVVKENALSSSTNRVRQDMGESDYWSIFGEASATDKGIMVFEVGDNGEPISGIGQKFSFRYNGSSSGTTKTVLDINYDNTMSFSDFIISPSASSGNLGGLKLIYHPDNASNRLRANLYIEDFKGKLLLKDNMDAQTVLISSEGNSYISGGNTGFGNNNPLEKVHISGGNLRVDNLSGTGTRTVVSDASGNLSATETVPLKYIAVISQSGTSNPVAGVNINTLGGTLVWTRTGTGTYDGTLSGAFPVTSKVILIITENDVVSRSLINWTSSNTVTIQTVNATTGALMDGRLNFTTLKIEVYP